MAHRGAAFRGHRATYSFRLGFCRKLRLVPYTLDPTMLSEISYFATYNRFATAILFLTGLWFVLPKSRGDGVLLGYLLTALIFFKITAAVAMLGLVVAAVLLGRTRLVELFSMLLVAGAAAGLVELATSGLVSGYLHDIASMSALNRGGSRYRLASSSARNWLPIVVTITIVALAIRELDFSTAVRRPFEFVRDTLVRQSEGRRPLAASRMAVCSYQGHQGGSPRLSIGPKAGLEWLWQQSTPNKAAQSGRLTWRCRRLARRSSTTRRKP